MCTICCLDCEPKFVAGNQIVSDHFDSMFLLVYWKLIDPFDAITTKHSSSEWMFQISLRSTLPAAGMFPSGTFTRILPGT